MENALWLIILGLLGLILSIHIYIKKKENKIKCLLTKKCDAVLLSQYNTTFGIKNEIMGIFYYASVILLAILFLSGILNIIIPIKTTLLLTGAIASLLSIYFLFIQAFVLKVWCEYCVASAILTFLIFLAELYL